MRRKAVSVFSGMGGLDLAAICGGFDVLVAIENNPKAQITLRHNFPETVILDDITQITAADIFAAAGTTEIDLMFGGWPCQGNSAAGRRAGLDDSRSGLWHHFERLVGEVQPSWWVGENVHGLLNVSGGRDFGHIQESMAALGRSFGWGVWEASDVVDPSGNPYTHARARCFCLSKLLGDRDVSRWVAVPGLGREGEGPQEEDNGQPGQPRTVVGAHCSPPRPPVCSDEAGLQQSVAEILQRLYGGGRDLRRGEGEGDGGQPEEREDSGLRCLPYHVSIPGPADLEAWADLLQRRPDLRPATSPGREIELEILPALDGISRRDALKLIGNAVVPAQAWMVFASLTCLMDIQDGL